MTTTQTRLSSTQDGALAMFERDTEGATLHVHRDDGLYRHLAVHRDDGSPLFDHQYEVITWPGHLTLVGGHGTWTFARADDMLNFFRQGGRRHVNLGYWAEKLQAGLGGGERSAKEFSESKYRAQVEQGLADWLDGHRDLSDEHRGEATVAVGAELLAEDGYDYPHSSEQAHELLSSFSHRIYEPRPSVTRIADSEIARLEFPGSWEWDFTDYSHHFIWSCYAIREAVWLYDAGRAADQHLAQLDAERAGARA